MEWTPREKSKLCNLFPQLKHVFSMNQSKSFISKWQYKMF
ncbi:hypothetical protein LT85_1765 [Collimonas arenae]|uniref:Uncharacterized protein n=1 Tax=Collimonas arenae TaxID=279058 RepID=A0A0A1F874_9BURK|nr:hypothetical protein LT85_1765 [Collimonas arenae]